VDGELSVRAASVAEARARVGGDPARTFAIDLTLGAWRARHAARELAVQTGTVLDERATPYDALEARVGGVDLGEVIGAGVDAESRGDATMRIAYDDARRIARALPRDATILVFGPRFGAPRRPENDAFVRFMREFAIAVREVVFDEGASDATHTVESALRAAKADVRYLVPGCASDRLDAAEATVSIFPGNVRVIEPALRADPRRVPRALFDRLAADESKAWWVRAYAQLFGNNLYVEARELERVAWSTYLEGGVEVALDLLDRAIACAKTPFERALALARAQGVRIAALRYDEAARAPEPPPNVPAELRDFIAQTKGWGLALDGKPLEAQRWFARPLAALEAKDELSVADLYLLNIYALSCFRAGDTSQALALERAIAERHAALPHQDARLEHINSINLARLLRRVGDADGSAEAYDRAFATSEGLREWPEVVQREAIAAGRAASNGNRAEADDAWLRAALAWLADPVPEALGRRTVAAVLEGPAPKQEHVADAVAAALLARIAPLASALPNAHSAVAHAAAVRAATIRAASPGERVEAVVGRTGWTVALCPPAPSSRARSAVASELERCVGALVADGARASGVGGVVDIAVDLRDGRDLARTRAQAYDLAVRRGARTLCFDGIVATLEPDERERALSRARLFLAPAIARIAPFASAPARAIYKRFLPPRELSAIEADLVAAVASAASDGLDRQVARRIVDGHHADERHGFEPSMADHVAARGSSPRTADEVIRDLTDARVLVLVATEDRCIEAGISSPSNAS
jgi:hypothetical protein